VADGAIERFRISESPVMEPGLQSKYTNIHSYVGQGLDDPSKTIRCDYTLLGFHAAVSSPNEKTFYVSSLNRKGRLYAVYSRSEKDAPPDIFKCTVDGSGVEEGGITGKKTPFTGNADDGTLRTYRLALCVAGEFSQFFLDGTEADTAEMKSKVMSVLTVYMDRANQVYERDFDVRLVLVDKEDTIIFINPQKDPFGSGSYNTASQKTCDNFIGSANYDIGHTITSKNLGGNAGCIGCVCLGTKKGSGYTGYNHPEILDYFVIDYWTHEVGHQFGANHTFDFSDEGTGANVEPGSGSTIMGYAGITGSTDVQPHSDDLFSIASIAQITNYIKSGSGGGRCAVVTVTGDHTPTANGGADHTIPVSTPFMLTGKGSDADGADKLSYIWEQVDAYETGASPLPNATTTKGPEYRAFNYGSSKFRVFPSDTTILRGALFSKWESLSAVSRDLNFRFTVRDNHVGGGNNKSDDVLITVSNTAGPFAVKAPNTAVSWAAGSTQTVKWAVANTDVAPVKCANVSILFSGDGGKTFKAIVKSTPNDGSQQITVPNDPTTKARIVVIAVGNIFFDASDVNFTVTAAPVATSASDANAQSLSAKWSVQPNPAKSFTNIIFNTSAGNVEIILSDASGKMISRKSLPSVSAGSVEKVSLQNLIKGTYFIKISSGTGTRTEKIFVD